MTRRFPVCSAGEAGAINERETNGCQVGTQHEDSTNRRMAPAGPLLLDRHFRKRLYSLDPMRRVLLDIESSRELPARFFKELFVVRLFVEPPVDLPGHPQDPRIRR